MRPCSWARLVGLAVSGVAAYTAPDHALALGSGSMPPGKELLLQCMQRMCDASSDTASNVSVSCSSCAELKAAGCSVSRCRGSCTPDHKLDKSPRVYVQISTGCSASTWSREFLVQLMEAHGIAVATPCWGDNLRPTLDGSELESVLGMRDKVPGLKDMKGEPASASAAWLEAMAACTREQGTALVVKITPSPTRLPLVAQMAKQNTRFVVMERIRTLEYILCMVRDCKSDKLTGVEPPGTPATRAGALALRAKDDADCFQEARHADMEVLARLDPEKLPAAVQGLLQRTGSHTAYLQQAGFTEKQRPSVISMEDLTALEHDTADEPYKALNQSVGAWMEALRSLSIAPDEDKVRDALLPLAHTRERTKPEQMISNWAEVEAQLHELGLVDSNGYATRDCPGHGTDLAQTCDVSGKRRGAVV